MDKLFALVESELKKDDVCGFSLNSFKVGPHQVHAWQATFTVCMNKEGPITEVTGHSTNIYKAIQRCLNDLEAWRQS